jgi:hypothetical protein
VGGAKANAVRFRHYIFSLVLLQKTTVHHSSIGANSFIFDLKEFGRSRVVPTAPSLHYFSSVFYLSSRKKWSDRHATAMKKTAQDIQLIRQMAELYREPEMDRARVWWRNEFFPESAADYLHVEMALAAPQNSWLGMVVNYWTVATSLVLHGTLSEQAFFDATFTDEMFEIFCKVQPFLKKLRLLARRPRLLLDVEQVITGSKKGRQRLAMIEKRSLICRKDPVERLARVY